MMTPEVEQEATQLAAVWGANFEELALDEASFQRIDGAIDTLRQETLKSLRALR
jgi:hypothetical protein